MQCRHSYQNWLVQLDPTTLQVIAISRKPVIESDAYQLEGYFEGVLIVGSYHILEAEGEQASLAPLQMVHTSSALPAVLRASACAGVAAVPGRGGPVCGLGGGADGGPHMVSHATRCGSAATHSQCRSAVAEAQLEADQPAALTQQLLIPAAPMGWTQ